MSVHVKICGITNVEDAELAVENGASAIGLNFVPTSPRLIDVEMARRIVERVGARTLTVVVVADRGAEDLRALLRATGARCLQLCGEESPELVAELLPHAYKSVRIGTAADVTGASLYPGEHLLVDAKVEGKLGGTGKTLDWALVEPLARARNLTLAGGLRPSNVADAIRCVRPFCVDVASGVERDGDARRKDPEKLGAFLRAVESAG
ncbi:MAG TPA: phosphoribosylanthranilate isomerase [Polyangiaceae bacterium]|nr:phosphoribosylanthranilate isomerase [Polyangiaceae bacterium]